MDRALDGRIYHDQLESVRLRIELASGSPDADPRVRAQIERALAEHAHAPTAGRAGLLAERLGLLDDEVELLWTAVALAADPRVQAAARQLGGADVTRGLPLALHARISGLGPDRARLLLRRLLAPNPLMQDGLLVWGDDPTLLPAARQLVAPARTIGWLAGIDAVDADLRGAGAVIAVPAAIELDPAQRAALAELRTLIAVTPAPLIVIEGPAGSGRRTAAALVAGESARRIVALDLRRAGRDGARLEAALLALRRECRLRDAIPLLANLDELVGAGDDGGTALGTLARALDAWPGTLIATSSLAGLDLAMQRTTTRVTWSVPDATTRRRLWGQALGPLTRVNDAALDDVAMRYRLGPGGIGRAAASSHALAGDGPLEVRHLVEGVRGNIAERLGELATRQVAHQTWDDLVLAPDLLDQVVTLVGRVRHAYLVLSRWGFASKVTRGGGVAALFSGPPGTGKSMVAGIIANELDLELYQVDLSKVVSKWVGETEKQLARVFEAAEAGHALLLFDEADALFAKRTEVSSANDRYANLEVNYLLQRIESFGGVTILTTNHDGSIDPALRRRLAASVVFWPPDVEERVHLWRVFLPPAAPTAGTLDFDDLARRFPEMTGANIRNAVVAAAFLAAAEDQAITHHHLERGARAEYLAMGRMISDRRN